MLRKMVDHAFGSCPDAERCDTCKVKIQDILEKRKRTAAARHEQTRRRRANLSNIKEKVKAIQNLRKHLRDAYGLTNDILDLGDEPQREPVPDGIQPQVRAARLRQTLARYTLDHWRWRDNETARLRTLEREAKIRVEVILEREAQAFDFAVEDFVDLPAVEGGEDLLLPMLLPE